MISTVRINASPIFAPVDMPGEMRRDGNAILQEPGRALAAKLCTHLRPKCHTLLLDASLSSAIAVRRNLFQMALLAAMKLHCQVSPARPHHYPARCTPQRWLQNEASVVLTAYSHAGGKGSRY